MIPSEWLLPQPRTTPGDSAAYWPDTCFLELPHIPLDDEQIAALDPNITHISSELAEYIALATHEHVHWIQAHAFAYGRFQALLDQTRTELVESFFSLFTSKEVREMLENRLNGQSLFKLDSDGRPVFREEFGPIGTRLQRHWWGLGILRHELDTANYQLGRLQSVRFRYGLAALYANALPDISKIATLPDDELRDAAWELAPWMNLELSALLSRFPNLGGMAIAECGAVLNQHWFYSHQSAVFWRQKNSSGAGRLWQTLVQSWESKEPTPYSDAFKVYSYFNPSFDLNAAKPLATLGVLCCVALDGQFPAEHGRRTRSWKEVSPALRFVALAKAVSKVGLVRADSVCDLSPDQYRGYVHKLCDAAGVAPPRGYSDAPRLSIHRTDSPTGALRNLFHDSALAASKLLQLLPAAVVAPAEADVYCVDALLTPEMRALNLARNAPLLILGNTASYIGIEEKQFVLYAVAGAYQRLMLQLFADCRPRKRGGLPSCARGRSIAETAVALAERRLSTHIPFSW